MDGVVAQLAERIVRNDKVVGSIPINSTKGAFPLDVLGTFLLFSRDGVVEKFRCEFCMICVKAVYAFPSLYSFNLIRKL